MAKTSGDTRASKWADKLYYSGGVRKEYNQLPLEERKKVIVEKKEVEKQLLSKLRDTSITKEIDNGENVEVKFTTEGVKHICNDAMINLSGKYFSKDSMMRIDEIFRDSVYIPTSHKSNKPRKDGRDLWFSYKDNDGRGVYFKANFRNRQGGYYELYSITEIP